MNVFVTSFLIRASRGVKISRKNIGFKSIFPLNVPNSFTDFFSFVNKNKHRNCFSLGFLYGFFDFKPNLYGKGNAPETFVRFLNSSNFKYNQKKFQDYK